ncbi:MAG: hypothetical protein FP827_04655 [Candidatus Omnitrophica bacterium]|nr:hypothetical protein [Candidatus Omnitrophota bacterium]
MSKVITLRLSQDEYKKISEAADIERRPISNFITTRVLTDIEDSYYADSIEMSQIKSDKRLLGRIKAGHNDAKNRKGKFVE